MPEKYPDVTSCQNFSQAHKFIYMEADKYGIPMELDLRYKASLFLYGKDGQVVEEISFANMKLDEIHNVVKSKGFLPKKQRQEQNKDFLQRMKVIQESESTVLLELFEGNNSYSLLTQHFYSLCATLKLTNQIQCGIWYGWYFQPAKLFAGGRIVSIGIDKTKIAKNFETIGNLIERIPTEYIIEVSIVKLTQDKRPVWKKYYDLANDTADVEFLTDAFKSPFVGGGRKDKLEFINKDNSWMKCTDFVFPWKQECIKWKVKAYYTPYNTRLNEALMECNNNSDCAMRALKMDAEDNSRSIAIYLSDPALYHFENLSSGLFKENMHFIEGTNITEAYIAHTVQIYLESQESAKYQEFAYKVCELKAKIISIIGKDHMDLPLAYRIPHKLLQRFIIMWEDTITSIKCRTLLSMHTSNGLQDLIDQEQMQEIEKSLNELKAFLVSARPKLPFLVKSRSTSQIE
eukprot:TRINITY_DN2232_c0_g1_i1.p2 TRINITY_DN2232_c0_g1~~TRINITY_DN2232_c0_g1_i1.p2  ORF type:complete len:460 (+),score=29.38 TRINITY_DN2232_c0_g1_i1:889-2268(+)